jgi:hypothetical protein
MLVTKVPKELHRRLRLHCVQEGVTVMSFVTGALGEALRRKQKPKPERRPRG